MLTPRSETNIGQLLAKKYHLSTAQVESIVEYQRQNAVKFGEAAVALGYLSRSDVFWALSQQFHYPYAPDDDKELPDIMITAKSPFSMQAEFFRDVRSTLLHQIFNDDAIPASLAVCSAQSGDGKTYFSVNLAIAFCQLGARTLLVDADLRNPNLQQIFNVESSSGLATVLAERTEADVFKPIESLPDLYLLPAGVRPPNPTELLQRAPFGRLMRELHNKFDYIIVDTPAAQFGSDAFMAAANCGASTVVARKNATEQKSLTHCINKIGKCPTKFAGVIYNDY